MVNAIDLMPDEEFIKLVKESSSTSDILRHFGYSVKGNSWGYAIVKERMSKLNIAFGKKLSISVSPTKMSLKDILTEDSGYNRNKLKLRLIQEGLKEYKCECCGIKEWNNQPISLQLHHINGINNDNRLENLQLLCPNCHSQTENFSTKGKGRIIQSKCDALPLEDKKKIMETVRELGIVEARKVLPYRNSLINSVVKTNKDKIVMICLDGSEIEFNTVYEASKYLFHTYGIGTNEDSSRTGISRCINHKQDSIKGYKFERRSAEK